jgi:hypothetical protein
MYLAEHNPWFGDVSVWMLCINKWLIHSAASCQGHTDGLSIIPLKPFRWSCPVCSFSPSRIFFSCLQLVYTAIFGPAHTLQLSCMNITVCLVIPSPRCCVQWTPHLTDQAKIIAMLNPAQLAKQFSTVSFWFQSPSMLFHAIFINHCTTTVSTSALYLGGPRLKSRPRDWLSWLRSFVVFLSPSRYCSDSSLVKLSWRYRQIHNYTENIVSFNSFATGMWIIY